MKECRVFERRFGGIKAFDLHLGSDAQLIRGQQARLRGESSMEGHNDPRGCVQDAEGIWRSPGPSEGAFATPYGSGGLLAGLAQDKEALWARPR